MKTLFVLLLVVSPFLLHAQSLPIANEPLQDTSYTEEQKTNSCFREQEEKLVAQAWELFLARMEEFYPDSMQNPFQTFLRQYYDIEIDKAFFSLDEAQRKAFQEGLPWTEYVKPESSIVMEIEAVIPPEVMKKKEARKKKLEERQYSEERTYLDIPVQFTRCLYFSPADREIYKYYLRYAESGYFASLTKANLMRGFLTEAHFQNKAVQRLIAVEIFLQRCINEAAPESSRKE